MEENSRENGVGYGGIEGSPQRLSPPSDASPDAFPSPDKSSSHEEYNRMRRNIVLLSLCYFLTLTSFHGVAILQSSMNSKDGSNSLAAMFITMFISSLFLTNWLISRISVKWSILVGFLCYFTYIIGQFYTTRFGLIFTGLLMGFGASPMWVAHGIYIAQVSKRMAQIKGVDPVRFTSQMFSFSMGVVQLSYCSGSLLSSSVLSAHAEASVIVSSSNISELCGSNFCPSTANSDSLDTLKPPNHTDVMILIAIFSIVSLIACGVLTVLVDPLSRFDDRKPATGIQLESKYGFDTVKKTFSLLFSPKLSLLYVISIWVGFSHGYLVSDYSAAYVACALGIHMIGYIVLFFGISNSMSNLLLIVLIRLKGRTVVFFLGSLLSILSVIFMFVWTNNKNASALLYIIPILWGFSDSINQSQSKALFGAVFASQLEEGFTCLSILESFGFFLNYILQPVLCNEDKLVMIILFVVIGFTFYFILEFRFYRKSSQEDNIPIISNNDIPLRSNN